MFKKIYTIFILILNFCIRRKHYRLHFIKKDNQWFYDFRWWGFDHDNLEMVCGADKLCEIYSNGTNVAEVDIIASKKRKKIVGYDEWVGESFYGLTLKDRLFWGRHYRNKETGQTFWICPVTLFVLGRYPNYIYIKNK